MIFEELAKIKNEVFIMDFLKKCTEQITFLIKEIQSRNKDSLREAACLISNKIEKGEIIYIFGGGGHSNMAAEEMFYRSGSLICVRPLFMPGNRMGDTIMLNETEGLAPLLFEKYNIKAGDVLIISNAYGTSRMNIDVVMEAKKRDVRTIGLTGTEFPKHLPKNFRGRHSSNKNLHEEVDIFIDTCCPYGDALVKVKEHPAPVGPASTILSSVALNFLLISVTEELINRNVEPPILKNANVIGGVEYNEKYLTQYCGQIPELSAFWTGAGLKVEESR